ncbi:MAG TPA: 4-alpha-glucanotransferase, partial [Vicinamibacteria bacterium]
MRSLRRLAAAYGVLTSYYGVAGLSRARPEALLAVLRKLGAPVERLEDAGDALRQRREETARSLVPPVIPLWDSGPSEALLTHRAGETARARGKITLEDGSERDLPLDESRIRYERDGFVRRPFNLPRLPMG